MNKYMRPDNQAIVVQPWDLIGGSEAREILGMNRATMGRWIQSGKLVPLAQLDAPGGPYVFDRTDVQRLAKQRDATARTKRKKNAQ